MSGTESPIRVVAARLCTKSHVNPDNHINPVKHAFELGVFTGFTGLDMIYMMIHGQAKLHKA